jgi:cytochrome P450
VISTESVTIGLAMGVTLREDLPKVEAALQRLYEYSDALIADRRANPREDFVTALVNASREEDGRLSDTELRDAMVLLIFGGFDTTRNQLGLAMQTFMAHPDQWRLLAERPELGGKAVEEVMRVNPTVRWVTREVLEDFEYEGVPLEAGTTVHLYSESAGTDPRVFAGGFDITAERKPHFGFGGGAHHCLGHFVARSDMSEALPLLARRMRDPHALPGATWLPDSGNTGPIQLPIGFTPAP